MKTEIFTLKEQLRIANAKLTALENETTNTSGSGIPISQLPSATDLKDSTIMPVVQDSVTSKTSLTLLKRVVYNNALKITIDTDYKYTLSEEEYNSCNTILIDENSKSYHDGVFELIFPYKYRSSSSRIMRIKRRYGVMIKQLQTFSTGTLNGIDPVNSIRIRVGKEDSEGNVVYLGDIVYQDEVLSMMISYDQTGILSDAIMLSAGQTKQLNLVLGGSNPHTIGVPFSELLNTAIDASEFQLSPDKQTLYLIESSIGSVASNPFARSLPSTKPATVPLNFLIKGGTGNGAFLFSGYEAPTDRKSAYLMFLGNQIYTTCLGGHFLRIRENSNMDNTTVTGFAYPFYPDTTATHYHSYNEASGTHTDAGSKHISRSGSGFVTGVNSGNRSFETAGRWASVRGFIYL
jgi:hypothetical protein